MKLLQTPSDLARDAIECEQPLAITTEWPRRPIHILDLPARSEEGRVAKSKVYLSRRFQV